MARTFQQALGVVWRNAYVRTAVLLLLGAAALGFLVYTRRVWLTFVIALLVAYLLQPVMNWCERRLRARWLGLLVVPLGLFFLLGLMSLLFTGLATQTEQFSRQLPELIERIVSDSERSPVETQDPAPPTLTDLTDHAYTSLGGALQQLADSLVGTLERFVTGGGLVGGVGILIEDAVQFVALIAMTLYLLMDLSKVGASFLVAVPKPYQPLATALIQKLEHSVGGYFRGQLLVAASVGAALGVGLLLLRVPLALSLGFLGGAFNLVPYLGVIISIVPSLLLAGSVGGSSVIGVIVLFTAVNQLEAHVLSPLVLGRTTKLHPITIIVAVLVGTLVFGFWGAVFAVPMTAFLKLLYTDYYLTSRFHAEG